jgi:hypothetical protein
MKILIVLVIVIAICCYSEYGSASKLETYLKDNPVFVLALLALILFAGSKVEGLPQNAADCSDLWWTDFADATYCPQWKGGAICAWKGWHELFSSDFDSDCCGTGNKLNAKGLCPPKKCHGGALSSDGECTCPGDKVVKGGTCECPEGTKPGKGDTCVAKPCDPPRVKDKCDSSCRDASCTAGQVYCNGKCTPDCSAGQEFDKLTGKCRIKCDSGEIYQGNKCVKDCSNLGDGNLELLDGNCVKPCSKGEKREDGICVSTDKPLADLPFSTKGTSGYIYWQDRSRNPMYLSWTGGNTAMSLQRKYVCWVPKKSGAVKVYVRKVPGNVYQLLIDNSPGAPHSIGADTYQLTDGYAKYGEVGAGQRWAIWEKTGVGGATTNVSIEEDGYISALRSGATRWLGQTGVKQAGASLSGRRLYGVWQKNKPAKGEMGEILHFSKDGSS